MAFQCRRAQLWKPLVLETPMPGPVCCCLLAGTQAPVLHAAATPAHSLELHQGQSIGQTGRPVRSASNSSVCKDFVGEKPLETLACSEMPVNTLQFFIPGTPVRSLQLMEPGTGARGAGSPGSDWIVE